MEADITKVFRLFPMEKISNWHSFDHVIQECLEIKASLMAVLSFHISEINCNLLHQLITGGYEKENLIVFFFSTTLKMSATVICKLVGIDQMYSCSSLPTHCQIMFALYFKWELYCCGENEHKTTEYMPDAWEENYTEKFKACPLHSIALKTRGSW